MILTLCVGVHPMLVLTLFYETILAKACLYEGFSDFVFVYERKLRKDNALVGNLTTSAEALSLKTE